MPWLSVCFGRRQKPSKRPSISPPLHLLLKPGQLQQHAFRAKPLRRPRPCHLCHQPVLRQASCCRVCNYICHQACEAKGEVRYVGRHARYRDTSRFIHRQWHLKRSATFPSVEAASQLQENQTPTISVPSSPKSSLKKPSNKKQQQNGGPERVLKFAVPTSNGEIITSTLKENPHEIQKREDETNRSVPQPPKRSSSQNSAPQHTLHGGVVAENGVARVTHSYKVRQNSSTMSQASTPYRASDESGTLRPSGESAGMQLSYVTERLLALWCPGDSAAEARQGLLRATALLRNKHGDHYMVFNLSPRTVARSACEEIEEPSVRELGWARGLAPPLERLCALCKELDAWLCAGPHRLAVLAAQNMAGRERLGVAISAFMHYSLICGGEDQALDRYAMSRFLEERIGDFQQPSNKRYVGYFSGLLSGNIKINAQPMYLTHVTLIGAPAFEPVDPTPPSPLAPDTYSGGGCRLFLKVYQGLVPVHTSPVYHVAGSTRRLTVALDRSLQLRGDVMLRCYHRHPPHQAALLSGEGRELIFSCQFHTCAVADFTLTFNRQELDHACLDLRFPLDGAVELTFSPSTTPRHPSPAPTPAVPVDYSPDPVTRWDSLDTLLSPVEFPPGAVSMSPHHQLRVGTSPVNQPLGVDTSEQHSPGYTPGPLDGSLYATVKKSPSGHSPTSTHQTPGPGGGGGVHSPHTVSMDSGISSAGNGQPQGGGGATDHHKMLDQLLSDMLHTVENIPDLPPTPKPAPTIDGIDDSLRALQEFQFSSPGGGGGDTGHSSSSFSSSTSAQPPPPQRRTSPPISPPQRPQLPTSSELKQQVSPSSVSYNTSTSPPPRPQLPTVLDQQSTSSSSHLISNNSQGIEDQQNIPYHARQDSQPFTYGVTPPDISTMSATMSSTRSSYSNNNGDKSLNHHNIPPGLRSPSLVRKASTGKKSTSSMTTTSPSFNYNNNNNNNTWSPASSKNNKSWNSTSTISTSENHHYYNNSSSLLMTNGRRAKSPLDDDDDTRDLLDGYTDTVGSSSSNGGLTWLQRQQQKLRDRKEQQIRAERHPHETRLLSELRSVQHRILKPGASSTPRRPSTEDGYASDTTLLLSGLEDELGPIVSDSPSPQFSTTPLVIHTGGVAPPASHNFHKSGAGLSAPSSPLLPNRSSSRERTLRYGTGSHSHHQELATIMSGVKPLSRQKSDTSFDRERPFVAVKRAHEQSRRLDSQTSPPNSPLSMLAAAHPLGQLQSYYTLGSQRQQNDGQSPPAGLNNGTDTPDFNHYQPCKPVITPIISQQYRLQPQPIDHLNNSPDAHHTNYQKPNTLDSNLFSPKQKNTSIADQYQHYQQPSSLNHSYIQQQKVSTIEYSPQQYQQYKSSASPQNLHSPMSNDEFDGNSRPQTPAFPVHPRTPYANNGCVTPQPGDGPSSGLPPKSPTAQRRERSMSPNADGNGSVYGGQSRRSSIHSSSGDTVTQEVSPANVKFVRDTSRYWYKPNISREEAIALLREQAPGTFVVRDSNSFPGAFGLALKVAIPPPTPPGSSPSRLGEQGCELVRHFLIEPTSRGVKLKGCANEPVFSSLSALVYQHSITAIALPCRLLLPEKDIGGQSEGHRTLSLTQQLLSQGAACNVLYLMTVDTESLTGPQAVRRGISQLFASRPLPKATIVHFKVSSQGITLTDNKRTLFFRRHYPVNTISYCGIDPDDHRWSQRSEDTGMPISSNRCFGFVARKPASQLSDNQCHIFAELEPEQPSTAIVNFVSKVMMTGNQSPSLGKANIV